MRSRAAAELIMLEVGEFLPAPLVAVQCMLAASCG
jgi:hypothetical protein